MSKKYFAYGSCTNVDSFKETMRNAGCEDRFHICGVGILNGYRLAFTRYSSKWGGGVLDIIESPEDYVLGVVYEIPERAIPAIDAREGAPNCYRRIDDIKVELGFEKVEVFTYMVIQKQMEEIPPTVEYFNVVYKGMEHRFPLEYVNKYLIDHCKNRFGICYVKLGRTSCIMTTRDQDPANSGDVPLVDEMCRSCSKGRVGFWAHDSKRNV